MTFFLVGIRSRTTDQWIRIRIRLLSSVTLRMQKKFHIFFINFNLKFYFTSIISVCSTPFRDEKEGSGSGSIPLTNGSGWPKNMKPDPDRQHCFQPIFWIRIRTQSGLWIPIKKCKNDAQKKIRIRKKFLLTTKKRYFSFDENTTKSHSIILRRKKIPYPKRLHNKQAGICIIKLIGQFKGTVSWDRFQKFWQKFTEPSLTKGRGWFLNFFRGFNDFIIQKVYLLWLMPVCVGLTMVCLLLIFVCPPNYKRSIIELSWI